MTTPEGETLPLPALAEYIAGCLDDDGKPGWASDVRKLGAALTQDQTAEAVELGPDGKEWAKTEAGYRHVESVTASAVEGPAGLVWYGHAVREAFVAGAEWQQLRPSTARATAIEEAAKAAQNGGVVELPEFFDRLQARVDCFWSGAAAGRQAAMDAIRSLTRKPL